MRPVATIRLLHIFVFLFPFSVGFVFELFQFIFISDDLFNSINSKLEDFLRELGLINGHLLGFMLLNVLAPVHEGKVVHVIHVLLPVSVAFILQIMIWTAYFVSLLLIIICHLIQFKVSIGSL